MEEGWLDGTEDDGLIEAIDSEGEFLGWMSRHDAKRLNLLPQIIETPPRYLKDPYVRYHAQLIEERGLLKDGRDLNDVQLILISSNLIKRREFESRDRERIFEENLLINNTEVYEAYMKKKKQMSEVADGADIEQRVPGSIEEFLAQIAAFSEDEGLDSDKEQEKAEGWLASFLDSEDLDQMSDD